jgi:hypothetical protein
MNGHSRAPMRSPCAIRMCTGMAPRRCSAMVVGAPPAQFVVQSYRWQLYEVQPVWDRGRRCRSRPWPTSPPVSTTSIRLYLSDGSIVFTSDRPRNGAAHLYPQHDEYESTATTSGLWRLDAGQRRPEACSTTPRPATSIPSSTAMAACCSPAGTTCSATSRRTSPAIPFGNFDVASEDAGAPVVAGITEPFPEPRVAAQGSTVNGHRFNNFFPWQIAQDGTAAEFLNHLGRHEFHTYFDRAFNNDSEPGRVHRRDDRSHQPERDRKPVPDGRGPDPARALCRHRRARVQHPRRGPVGAPGGHAEVPIRTMCRSST